MKSPESCIITNKTKGKLPSLPFVSIKNTILGEKYDLSIGILSPAKQKEINRTYRGINETTNILSFPFSKNSGEITLDLSKIKKMLIFLEWHILISLNIYLSTDYYIWKDSNIVV